MASQTNKEPTVPDEISSPPDTPTQTEKKEIHTTVEEVLSPSDVEHATEARWTPGFWIRFPWIGFCAFITIFIAVAMAVVILVESNGKPAKNWPTMKFPAQPNVLVNICNQVANLGLITAIGQGLAIAWWRKALQGDTVESLHRNHSFTNSFLAVLISGKHFNLIALAALATKFTIIDSTLFQKSTKAVISWERNYTTAPVTAWLANEWEGLGNSGIPGDTGETQQVGADWANVLDAFSTKIASTKLHDLTDPNLASFTGCPPSQECTGRAEGLGFQFQCNQTVEEINYGEQHLSDGNHSTIYPLWDVQFSTDWSTDDKPAATIIMTMLYTDTVNNSIDDCPGTRTTQVCEILPAIVNYPLLVMTPSTEQAETKNIVTHIKFYNEETYPSGTLPSDGQIDNLEVTSYYEMHDRNSTTETSTIGALTFVLNNLFQSSATLQFGLDNDWDISINGADPQSLFWAADIGNLTQQSEVCGYATTSEKDPFMDLIRRINTLGFVTAVYLNRAPFNRNDTEWINEFGPFPSQTFQTTVDGIVDIYRTNYTLLAGALATTFLTILCVLPVYWRFWELGRKFTLGAVFIANAFNAPVLGNAAVKKDGDIDELLEEVGTKKVQFGQLVDGKIGHMGIAEPGRVVRPDSVVGKGRE